MYTGLEPVISAVTGRHPNQLNEYTYLKLKKDTLIYKILYRHVLPINMDFVIHPAATDVFTWGNYHPSNYQSLPIRRLTF